MNNRIAFRERFFQPALAFGRTGDTLTILGGAAAIQRQVWAFDPDTTEYAASTIRLPGFPGVDVLHGRVFWEYAGSPTAFVVRWSIGIGWATAGGGFGNLVNNIDDTGTAASTLHVTDWTTLTSSPALSSWDADSVMKLSLSRAATHANDTLDVDAYAVGVELEYQRVVGQQI